MNLLLWHTRLANESLELENQVADETLKLYTKFSQEQMGQLLQLLSKSFIHPDLKLLSDAKSV